MLATVLAPALSCTSSHPSTLNGAPPAATVSAAATSTAAPPAAAATPAPTASVAAGEAPRTFDPPGGSAAWAQRASGCHGVPLPPGSAAPAASDTGVSPTEMKLGVTWPLSGPIAPYGLMIKTMTACFDAVNAEGGIYGRRINWIVEDDAYVPADSLQLTEKLVEGQQVFAMKSPLGTPSNAAVVDYLNQHHVPNLFVTAGTSAFSDPGHYPWTVGWTVPYSIEGADLARYVQQTFPGKKVGILYAAGDYGDDFLAGITRVVGAMGTANSPIVAEETYFMQRNPPEVEPQLTRIRDAGADVLMLITQPGPAASAIKWAVAHAWKPAIIVDSVAVQQADLVAASGGAQNAEGVVTDWISHLYDEPDPAIAEVKDFLRLHAPQLDANGSFPDFAVGGYMLGEIWIETLKRAGVNPTRASLIQAAESFRGFVIPQFLPGISVDTSATNHAPIRCVQMQQFHGGKLVAFGAPVCAGS